MNALAFITAVGLACAVIAVGVGIAAFVIEPRRRRAATVGVELPAVQEDQPEPTELWIELAEQRRELEELRSKVARLEEQPR